MKWILFLLCFLSLNTLAQTREELINQVVTFYQAGEFEKAVRK